MKKFISGTLTGAILAGTAAFAAVYTAEPATFKVLVNGEEFDSNPPAMVIDGSTYLPLRAMGNALGVPVEWNSKLNQAEVGNSAPKAEENQYSRNNPAPINTIQTYTRKNQDTKYMSLYSPGYTANIRVLETIRGDKAWKMIEDANMFNSTPKEGYEYIIAKVAFSALSVQEDVSVNASYFDFDFFSGNNEEYDSVSVVMDDMLNKSVYSGGNAEGYVVGMVKTDDKSPKLVYGFGNESFGTPVWFALQ